MDRLVIVQKLKNMFGVIFDLLNYNSVSQIINLISKNVIQNKIPNSWLSDNFKYFFFGAVREDMQKSVLVAISD